METEDPVNHEIASLNFECKCLLPSAIVFPRQRRSKQFKNDRFVVVPFLERMTFKRNRDVVGGG